MVSVEDAVRFSNYRVENKKNGTYSQKLLGFFPPNFLHGMNVYMEAERCGFL